MAAKKRNPNTSKPAKAIVSEQVNAAVNGDDRDAPPEQKAQLRQWLDTIEEEKSLHKDLWRDMRKYRRAAAGKSNYAVHVNLHQASLETLLPILYAQDPEVQVKPARSVDQSRYQAVKAFATTLEIVTQRELAGENGLQLKTTCERAIRAAKTVRYGIVKVCFQTDTEQDPEMLHRIADVQDNLQRAASLTEDVNEGCGNDESLDAKRQDLQDTLVALQEKVEVLKSIGVVLDIVSPDDFIIPHDVSELIDYATSPWLAQRIWLRKEKAKEEFSLNDEECGSLTTYPDREKADGEADTDAREASSRTSAKKGEKKSEFVVVWEIWDRRNNMVYTVMEGLTSRYAKPPFAPRFVGRRFYSFFLLAFAWVDGEREPLSAVDMADPLVDEYNGTRSGYREHRENAVPCTVFDSSLLSVEDAEKLKNRKRIESVGLDVGGNPVANSVLALEYPRVDPALYDTTVIRGELDQVYGVQDAMRGQVMKAKTLGEAEIMQQGLATRTGGQRGALESWLGEIANFTAEVLLLAMPKAQVMEIAGQGAQWPALSRAQIQNDVVIDIRAGSTGKPDQQKDVQNWQELSTALLNMLDKYTMALETGKQGLADAYKAIFAETLRRLDERLDPEQFLPKVAPMPPPPPPPQPLPDTALMGPQVQALQAIVVAAGALGPARATALIQAAFPHIPPPLVEQLVAAPALPAAAGVPAEVPGAAAGAPLPAPGAPAPNGLPHPDIVKEGLELAKKNPEVGKAVHAAVEHLRAAQGGGAAPPPPPG